MLRLRPSVSGWISNHIGHVNMPQRQVFPLQKKVSHGWLLWEISIQGTSTKVKGICNMFYRKRMGCVNWVNYISWLPDKFVSVIFCVLCNVNGNLHQYMIYTIYAHIASRDIFVGISVGIVYWGIPSSNHANRMPHQRMG